MRASLVALLFLAAPAFAVTIEKPLDDPAQEQVARQVIGQLRCVVCEGQSLADSDAGYAREMRAEIRRMAEQGKDSKAITRYFRERYGASILLTPPLNGSTLMLWVGPLLLLLLGGGLLWRFSARRQE